MLEVLRGRWWHLRLRASAETGLSLVELLVAFFVLSVAVLALASTAAASVTSLRVSRERQQATAAASAAIEDVRRLPYEEVAHRTGSVSAADDTQFLGAAEDGAILFAHDDMAEEPLAQASNGGVDPHRWNSGPLTVRVFVTWYDDPDTARTRDAKRITAIASWDDPSGGSGEVRQSTLVAPVDRGLPQPRFDLSPKDLFQHAEPVSNARICFTHLIRNIGATDNYSWQLLNHGGNAANYVNGHTMRANGWDAQVWFGTPDYGDDGAPNTAAANLWKDTTGDQRPDSPWPLPTAQSEPVTVCYTSKNSSANDHNRPDLSFVVRSAFDPSVQTERIYNRIERTQTAYTLYLHHPDNNGNQDRELGAPYRMDEDVPYQEDDEGEVLDLLYDYDRNLDDDQRGGILLPAGGDGAVGEDEYTGMWTYNGFSAGTELSGGELTLHSAWTGAFDGSNQEPDLTFGLGLDLVSGTGDLIESFVVSPSTRTYTHTAQGWMVHTTVFEVLDDDGEAAAITFSTGEEHLRLRVWCAGGQSQPDCNLAYDTNTHRSSLVVREP